MMSSVYYYEEGRKVLNEKSELLHTAQKHEWIKLSGLLTLYFISGLQTHSEL